MNRIHITLSLAAAFAVGACSTSSKALNAIPEDAVALGGVDLEKARGSDVWARGSDLFEELEDELDDKGMDKLEEALESLKEDAGLDLNEDVHRITYALLDEDNTKDFLVVVEGRNFDGDALAEWAAEQEDAEEMDEEDVGDVTLYVSASGKGAFAVPTDSMLLFGAPDRVEEAIERLADGDDNVRDNEEIMAAMKKVDSKAALWMAVPMSGKMAKRVKDLPIEGADEALHVVVNVVLDDGVATTFILGYEDEKDAEEVADGIDGLLKLGKKMAKDGLAGMPCGKELKGLTEAYTLETDGGDVRFELTVDGDLYDDIAECGEDTARDAI